MPEFWLRCGKGELVATSRGFDYEGQGRFSITALSSSSRSAVDHGARFVSPPLPGRRRWAMGISVRPRTSSLELDARVSVEVWNGTVGSDEQGL